MKFLGNFAKEGKGVRKADVTDAFTIKRFFTTLGDKFWRIVVLNLLYFGVNLPVFGLFAYAAGVAGIPFFAPVNVLYQPLYGVMKLSDSPALQALWGVVGVSVQQTYPSTWTKVFLFAGLLVILTFGLGNAGMTFVIRQYVRREPCDLGADFFSTIKKNFKQAIGLGVIDLVIVFVIAYDLVSYGYSGGTFFTQVLLYLTLFLFLLYLLMRPYMYLMIITFDLSIARAIKNAYILAVAGIRRNLFCGFFAALVWIATYIVFCFLPPLGALMVFFVTVTLAWLLQIYGAWPVVKKHMIDPYYEEKAPAAPSSDPVFEDRTE